MPRLLHQGFQIIARHIQVTVLILCFYSAILWGQLEQCAAAQRLMNPHDSKCSIVFLKYNFLKMKFLLQL